MVELASKNFRKKFLYLSSHYEGLRELLLHLFRIRTHTCEMTLKHFILINYVQLALSLVILIMSVVYFRRRIIETKLLALHFLLAFAPYLIIHFLALTGKAINIPQNAYMLVQMFTLSLLFAAGFGKKNRSLLLGVGLIYAVFWFVNFFFFQKDELNTYTKVFGSIIFIFYCLLYYHRLLTDLPVQELQRMPMFWYVTSNLVYNAGTLFLLLFTTYLVEVLHNDLLIYWSFHNILDIIQDLLVMVGLWQDLRNIRLHS